MVEFADFDHEPAEILLTETPMTETTVPLIELLRKRDEGNFLRVVTEAVLRTLMERDVEGVIGAARYERGDARQTWRNGHRDREPKTRLGAPNLRVPKLRTGSCFPGFLEPRRTSEKALIPLAIVLGPMADEARARRPGSEAFRRVGSTSSCRP